MSYQPDENKGPKTNQDNHAATGNVQESFVKKEKTPTERTTENLTEEEKIMLMMKESTEAYDTKYYNHL
ncbi:hypothetical protein T09_9668 [Trichinella sp. T9]|nr:hypothetical protein T09_9668 [Trichinella sp. T9]